MNQLEETSIQCPYCGETLGVLIDCSVPHQQYIEDCQICCQPINFNVSINDDGSLSVIISNDNE